MVLDMVRPSLLAWVWGVADHPQICHTDISVSAWKTANAGWSFFGIPLISKDKYSRRKSIVINPLLRSVINKGRLTLIKERPEADHTQAYVSQIIILSINSSKAHTSVLKVIDSPIRCLHPSSLPLLRWHLILNSKAISLSYSFSLGVSHAYIWYTC